MRIRLQIRDYRAAEVRGQTPLTDVPCSLLDCRKKARFLANSASKAEKDLAARVGYVRNVERLEAWLAKR